MRVTGQGKIRPAAMSRYRWRGKRTEITVRDAEVFADGTRLDAGSVRPAFDEQIRWEAPHPPGTHFNIDRRTRAEVVDDRTVRLHLPEVDGLALGKLRATHASGSGAIWVSATPATSPARAIGELARAIGELLTHRGP